jgi:hypothetical protein
MQWIVAQEKEGKWGGKNSDKKIVTVKLIVQIKNKTGTATTKSSLCSVKVLHLFLLHSILVLVVGILDSGLCGEGCSLVRWLEGIFFFFVPLSLVLWSIHYQQELWSGLTRWLACEQYLVPSFHKTFAIGTWGNSLPVCARLSDLLFSPGGSCIAPQLKL